MRKSLICLPLVVFLFCCGREDKRKNYLQDKCYVLDSAVVYEEVEIRKSTYTSPLPFFDSIVTNKIVQVRKFRYDSVFPYIYEYDKLVFSKDCILYTHTVLAKHIPATERIQKHIFKYKIEEDSLFIMRDSASVKRKIVFNADSSKMSMDVPQNDRKEVDKLYYSACDVLKRPSK